MKIIQYDSFVSLEVVHLLVRARDGYRIPVSCYLPTNHSWSGVSPLIVDFHDGLLVVGHLDDRPMVRRYLLQRLHAVVCG